MSTPLNTSTEILVTITLRTRRLEKQGGLPALHGLIHEAISNALQPFAHYNYGVGFSPHQPHHTTRTGTP